MLPKFNPKRALFVLTKIDQILAWEQKNEAERDTRFVELGRYLCEVRTGQYWRLDNLKSFDEFLERRFPESRRKAYYLMSIHEHLPPQARRELKEVGWTKGLELAKLARAEGQRFDCATWLHKARSLPKDQFKREVEKELTGQETEPWEIVYFKLYKTQIPVIEQAMENSGLDARDGQVPGLLSGDDLCGFPGRGKPGQREPGVAFAFDLAIFQVPATCAKRSLPGTREPEGIVNRVRSKQPRWRVDADSYRQLQRQVLERDGWRCQSCGSLKSLEVHHKQLRSHCGSDLRDNLITLCHPCHSLVHG